MRQSDRSLTLTQYFYPHITADIHYVIKIFTFSMNNCPRCYVYVTKTLKNLKL